MKKLDISINLPSLISAGVGASIALFSAGSVAGYFYAKKKLIVEFNEKLEHEIRLAREAYKKLNKAEEFATPEAAAQALGVDMAAGAEVNRTKEERLYDDAVAAFRSYKPDVVVSDATLAEAEAVREEEIKRYRGKNVVSYNGVMVDPVSGETVGPAVENEPTQVVKKNVFDQDPSIDFDYADEVAARTDDRPYIISQAEWEDNDFSHEQITMTYYEGDKTVADPNDMMVALVDETIGWDNLRFGHRSNDNSVVYIRHEMYKLDMEIVRDERTYKEIVAGFAG